MMHSEGVLMVQWLQCTPNACLYISGQYLGFSVNGHNGFM